MITVVFAKHCGFLSFLLHLLNGLLLEGRASSSPPLVGWFVFVCLDWWLLIFFDELSSFNIHAFYKCRGSRKCLPSSPLQPQPVEYGHEYSHSQQSVVRFQYPLPCIGQGPLLIAESLSTARATVEGPFWKGRVSETCRTDWRQAGPGFEKRPWSLKYMFRRTRELLT